MEKPKEFLYSVKCPKCGTNATHKFVKSWTMTGKGEIKTRVEMYRCQECRRKWRRGVNLNLVKSPRIRREIDA